MKSLIIFSMLASGLLAAPLGLTKLVELSEAADSKCVHTIYRDGEKKVFISSIRTSTSGAFIFQSEFFFFEGKAVYWVSRSAEAGIGTAFTQYPELKGLQITIADENRDGLPDSVLFTGELGEVGFQRKPTGEMVPICPLIIDEIPAPRK